MKFCKEEKLNFEWFFPVRGHSYMPADRSFGYISRKIKKEELILLPEKYDELVKTVGSLYIVEKDLHIYDHKKAAAPFLKVCSFLFAEVTNLLCLLHF